MADVVDELYCACVCHYPDPVLRTDPIAAVSACDACAKRHPGLNNLHRVPIEPTVWDEDGN